MMPNSLQCCYNARFFVSIKFHTSSKLKAYLGVCLTREGSLSAMLITKATKMTTANVSHARYFMVTFM